MNSRIGGMLSDLLLIVGACSVIFFGVIFYDHISQVVTGPKTNGAAQKSTAKTEKRQKTSARSFERIVYLRADRNNQFYADAYINGRPISVLVDTGASHVALRHEDAESIGIYLSDRDYTHRSRTANGITRVAPILIDRIRIGDVEVRDVEGFVGEPGKSFSTLLGMTFLKKLTRMNFEGRSLELVQ